MKQPPPVGLAEWFAALPWMIATVAMVLLVPTTVLYFATHGHLWSGLALGVAGCGIIHGFALHGGRLLYPEEEVPDDKER